MRKYKPIPRGCTGGWEKPDGGPLIGRDTCIGYDMSIMKEGDTYRMWYSSAAGTISHATSTDGVHWELPTCVQLLRCQHAGARAGPRMARPADGRPAPLYDARAHAFGGDSLHFQRDDAQSSGAARGVP